MEKNEIMWKKIEYPGIRKNMYLISENGDVMNIFSGKTLTPYPDKDGYLKIGLVGEISRTKNAFIHRLVGFAFVENPNNYPVIDHLDGVKTHNHYTNLEWVTIKENTNRAERMGLRKIQGADNGNSKYSEEFVRSICEKYEQGLGIKDVYQWILKDPNATSAKDWALYQLLYSLKRKEGWSNVVCDYTYDTTTKKTSAWTNPIPQTSNFKYSEEEIRYICKMLEEGNTVLDIVEKITGNRDTSSLYYDLINGIRTGKNWTHISKEYNINRLLTTDRCTGWDENIANLVDEGYSKKQIRRMLGVKTKSEDLKGYYKINGMIDRYKRFKECSSATIFYIHF